MQRMPINGLTLFFSPEEQGVVDLVSQACVKSMRLLQDHLGLETPKDCRVYIMTSWLDFMFHSAPWSWKVLMAVTLPLWVFRARKIWPLAGGWAQRYGRRRAVGVKPPRLLKIADTRIGDRIFVKEEDAGRKVQSITCHELTHAYTAHLGLPTWLNEGLAMVMVDRYFEMSTVRFETLDVLERSADKHSSGGRQRLRIEDEDSLVYMYVHGYWCARFLDETRPGLLKDLLSRRCKHKELEDKIAAAYGAEPGKFWDEMDGELVPHFTNKGDKA